MMNDPFDALQSFQEEASKGNLRLQPGTLDTNLYSYLDQPNGTPRLTFIRLDERTVTAFASFVSVEPVDGEPCFEVGYAVPELYRNQGRAKELVAAAIAEMQNRFCLKGICAFHVEAIVSENNHASQRIAQSVISNKPISITEESSGERAFQYLRRIIVHSRHA